MRLISMLHGSLRFKWTMRSIALIELFMLVISNFVRIFTSVSLGIHLQDYLQTLKRRIDPQEEAGSFFTVHEFKKPAFNAFTISGILCFLGFTRRFRHPSPVANGD